MSSNSVVSSQEQAAGEDWIRRFQASADLLDPSPWISSFFASNTLVHFGNSPPLQGHSDILAAFMPQMAAYSTMKHTPNAITVLPDRIHQSCLIKYTLKNDPEQHPLLVRGFLVVHKAPAEEKLREMEVYGDWGPVRDRIAELQLNR